MCGVISCTSEADDQRGLEVSPQEENQGKQHQVLCRITNLRQSLQPANDLRHRQAIRLQPARQQRKPTRLELLPLQVSQQVGNDSEIQRAVRQGIADKIGVAAVIDPRDDGVHLLTQAVEHCGLQQDEAAERPPRAGQGKIGDRYGGDQP